MQVVLLSTVVPMVDGGGRLIVDSTAAALRARGHDVEVLSVPFDDDPHHLVEQMAGLRSLPVADGGERLVAVRWPAHVVRHPNKVAWFIHHHRVFFDLWDTPLRHFPDTSKFRGLRELLRNADNRTLRECRDVFANSRVVADRLRRYNDLDAQVLLPPLPDERSNGVVGDYGDYVLYPSRVTQVKRQDLALEAMARTVTDVRLVIAGRPESEEYADRLRRLVTIYDLSDRVDLRLEWVPQEEMQSLLSGARAVLYVPVDEDSYGYPSLEAAAHARPLLTVLDSGGVLEFVQHGVSGLVAEPTATGLAAALDALYSDPGAARRMGAASAARAVELGISWDHVVARLLGEAP